jgi:hypothetical protein
MADLTTLSVSKLAKAVENLTTKEAVAALAAEVGAENRAGALEAIFSAHREDLVAEILAPPEVVTKQVKVAADAGLTATTVSTFAGILSIAATHTIATQWNSVSNSPVHFVDIHGPQAAYLAGRAPGHKEVLADKTWRITCTNQLQAQVVRAQADHLIKQELYTDTTTAVHPKLDPCAILEDATRAGGVGEVKYAAFHAVGIAGLSKVTAYHDADGKLVKVEIT